MTKRKKILIIVGSVVGALLLIALGVGLYFVNNIEKKVYTFLRDEIEKSTDGLYHLNIRKININVLREKINLKDIQLNVDTAAFRSKKEKGDNPKFSYDVSIKEIDINTSGLVKSYLNKSFKIDNINVLSPDVKVYEHPYSETPEDTLTRHTKSVWPSFIHGLVFKEILINSASVYYLVKAEVDSLFYTVENSNIRITDLMIDSSFNLSKGLPYYGEFELQVGTFKNRLNNYDLVVKKSAINLKGSSMHIDSVQIIPLYEKYEFAYIAKVPARVELLCEDIDLVNFDFLSLAYARKIKTDSMNIGNLVVSSYKNKNVPPTPIVKPLFHNYIQNLPLKIEVPVVEISKGHVVHEELAVNADESGYIEFSGIKGKIKDMTNIVQDKDQYFTLEANGVFMKTGCVDILFKFPVDPQNQKFNISGSMKGLDMTEINTILEPAAHINVEDGKLQELYFNMNGVDKTASIDMIMRYNNLNIALLTKDNVRKKWLLSELAKDLFLIESNPDLAGRERNARATVTRNLYLSEFNFLWLALFEGIKQSIGLSKETQEKINNLQERFKSTKIDKETVDEKRKEVEQKKNDREDKKNKRAIRRQKRKSGK